MKKIKWFSIILLLAVAMCGLAGCGENSNVAEQPIQEGMDYDVIVVGGDPEGVCAAVSSARSGLKTLLIEDDEALGGLMTLGKLNFIDICESRDGSILTQGLFMEFYDAVGGTAFDVETAKQFFYDWVVNEKNATLKLNTEFIKPVMDGDTIVGVVVEENGEQATYTASRIIDATVDADVAAAAGAPYTVAGEDIGEKERHMGVTLVFELSGVNWDKVVDYLENDDNEGTGATDKTAWGYTREGYAYEPKDDLMRLRGFNVARQDNGNVLVNALIIFGVDAMSEESKAQGIARAQKELEYIVPYVRENFIGFENVELAGTASQLYIRESRHIIGEYQLTIDDVLENRDQWDKIAIVAYPADIQPTAGQTYGTVIGSPDRYAIPFRSIVPLEVENMLVIGRSASYTSLAAGSARVIPVGMAEGEAAGVASAYSLNNAISFRDMSADEAAIADVQKTLKKQGAYLDDFEVHEAFMEHWAYPGVKVIRSLGLLDGGYSNDYRLDEPMGKWRLQNMINNSLKKTGSDFALVEDITDPVTNGNMIAVAARLADVEADSYTGQLSGLQEKGIVTEEILNHMGTEHEAPMAAEAIMIVANLYNYYLAQ
ncbi:MAG: FAD-dependent oxidoreductase [Peptococcaceae bacterium]|jgi:acyl-coenzyme A thioesterase PaaI-like protein|nr:FAD-dependent oxidoreductase [Peptococcaceae bacterium]MBQ2015293.1 FAD-dependent oxidoreductase [Peptococcaceae bacterium]MBQ2119935.1 FAD-dependent oxidoreductase [Peptococcaceae bacterium]MBQ5703229.1 FAD-dependent oxidoreductase [Peptococcaceae bacterium]MBQ5858802.1 FAD-dependent oxidoreductase [Peptococcaceae bacterium]